MARRGRAGDLPAMYTTSLYTGWVRDGAPAYGADRPAAGEFPAGGVLRDLEGAPTGDAPAIVTRYTALRAWLLGRAGDGLAPHARRAAAAHLAAMPPDWPEREPLARLVDRGAPWDPAALRLVADRAEVAGHLHGAYAALYAAYMEARRRGSLHMAGDLATAMGDLLRGRGGEGADDADRWTRRGRRLRRLSDAAPPGPS